MPNYIMTSTKTSISHTGCIATAEGNPLTKQLFVSYFKVGVEEEGGVVNGGG